MAKFIAFLLVVFVATAYCEDDGPKPTNATTPGQTTDTTTTLAPTLPPLPDRPKDKKWSVKNGNETCLMLQAGFRFHFKYDNGSSKNAIGMLDLPVNQTTMSGRCMPQESLTLAWDMGELSMVFTNKSDDKGYWSLNTVTFQYTIQPGTFPKQIALINETAKQSNLSLFGTNDHISYQCKSKNAINFTASGKSLQEIDTYSFQVQAGMHGQHKDFSTDSSVCSQDTDVSNIVPIAVGAALGALVLIVLVAYLIGRRRTKRGYESV